MYRETPMAMYLDIPRDMILPAQKMPRMEIIDGE
jgi:hypothetical protein